MTDLSHYPNTIYLDYHNADGTPNDWLSYAFVRDQRELTALVLGQPASEISRKENLPHLRALADEALSILRAHPTFWPKFQALSPAPCQLQLISLPAPSETKK